MIDYVFYILVCFCLVVFQTAILPYVAFFNNCYDLLIPLILYMAFFRPVFESTLVVLVTGLIMDSMTGGTFGIFISIYFWLFVGTRLGMQYFHSETTILLPFVIGAGVLVENLILLSVTAVITKEPVFPSGAAEMVTWQVFWAAISGPIVFLFIKFVHAGLNTLREESNLGRNSQRL